MSEKQAIDSVEQEFTTYERKWEASPGHAQYEKLGWEKNQRAKEIKAETIWEITKAELDELYKEVWEKQKAYLEKNIAELSSDWKLSVADLHEGLSRRLDKNRSQMEIARFNSQLVALTRDFLTNWWLADSIIQRIEKFYPEFVGTPEIQYMKDLITLYKENAQLDQKNAQLDKDIAKLLKQREVTKARLAELNDQNDTYDKLLKTLKALDKAIGDRK